MNRYRLLLIFAMLVSVGLFFAFGLQRFFTLEALKSQQTAISSYQSAHPVAAGFIYAAVYVLVTGLSLPGAAVMTLAGGAVFGLWWGTLLVSFASSIGATLAFVAARFLFRDAVKVHFWGSLNTIDKGMARDGWLYLLTLRLVPLFPFFLINLAMGLTAISIRQFYWVSQLGMLAGTVVYVNAGTQLAKIDSLAGIVSATVLLSFALLGIFPWLARQLADRLRAQRVYAKWPKPKHFDRNLVVIGAGAAGLVTAYSAAAVKAKVTLVEKHRMGGDCLNTGCVPSKALICTANFLNQTRRAKTLGIARADVEYDFADVMARVHRVIATVEPHDSVERYTKLGVEVIQGEAHITSPWTVEVNGQTLTTRAIVIATGARPTIPRIPGLEAVRYYTSDTIWSLTERPERLLVLGGGPVGCELAQAFARLGCKVTQVVRTRLLRREDSDAAAMVEAALQADGVRVLTHTETLRCEHMGEGQRLVVGQQGAQEEAIPFDALLCAVGRTARAEGFGLEELGIPLTPQHTVETDAWLQTLYPNIFAAGDVAGPFQHTHTAAHQAWYAAVNALFGGIKRFKVDYSVIPRATFTDPEVARVGLSEQEAQSQGIGYETVRYELGDLDRAIADEAAHGFVKVLTVPGKDKILGATIVGEHAGDLLAEFVLAMRHGLGLNKILATLHIYPTWSEGNKLAAGAWKRAHAPEKLLGWVERYHAWRRGGQFSVWLKP